MHEKIIQETFDKALDLLEKKLHAKIKTAVLTIRTKDGEYEVSKGHSSNITIMQLGSVQTKVAALLQRPSLFPGQIAICSLCGGNGRDLDNSFQNCATCKGGGQIILIAKGEDK